MRAGFSLEDLNGRNLMDSFSCREKPILKYTGKEYGDNLRLGFTRARRGSGFVSYEYGDELAGCTK
jgi:hypothetical protein